MTVFFVVVGFVAAVGFVALVGPGFAGFVVAAVGSGSAGFVAIESLVVALVDLVLGPENTIEVQLLVLIEDHLVVPVHGLELALIDLLVSTFVIVAVVDEVVFVDEML